MGSSLQTGVPTAPLMPGGSALSGGLTSPGGISLPPTLYPPPGSRSFNLADEVATIGAGTLTELTNCQLQLPPTNVGVISSIELLIDGILITTRLFFRLIVNGSPIPGWGSLTVLARNGAANASRSLSGPLGIELPAGAAFTVKALNQDGGNYTVGANLYGWEWPAVR